MRTAGTLSELASAVRTLDEALELAVVVLRHGTGRARVAIATGESSRSDAARQQPRSSASAYRNGFSVEPGLAPRAHAVDLRRATRARRLLPT